MWGEAVINVMAPAGESRADQPVALDGRTDRNDTRFTATTDSPLQRRTGITIDIQGRRP